MNALLNSAWGLCAMCLCSAVSPAGTRADEVVTVRLSSGAQITGPLLRQNDEGVVIDLGSEVVAIPARQVVEIVHDVSGGSVQDASQAFDIYSQGKLKRAAVTKLVDTYGDAVLTVTTPVGVGSGFLISPQGHFITNYHVVEETLDISATLFQKTKSGYERKLIKNVKILAVNPHRDLALLKIDVEEIQSAQIPHVILSRTEVAVGDMVFAIGNPLGLERSVTQGIVSSVTRTLGHLRFVQTDAAVNPGNSGGPLFNLRGEVVGVACSGYATFDGLAFGIPVSDLVDFLKHRDAYLFDETQPQNGVKYLAPPFLPKAKPQISESSDATE